MENKEQQQWREFALQGNLHFFTCEQSNDKLQLMCERYKDDDGRSLFHYACVSGNLDLVRLLFGASRSAVVNAKDESGWTPLLSACSCGHRDIVSFLIEEAGADIETKTPQGRGVFHYAASSGKRRPNQEPNGQTVQIQPGRDIASIARMLVEAFRHGEGGQKRIRRALSARDCTGSTPMHRAAACGRVDIMDVFVQAIDGSDSDTWKKSVLEEIKDGSGMSALDVATVEQNNTMVAYIHSILDHTVES